MAEYSSDLAKHERERTLRRFRKKRLQVLVTTDVLARGIDLPGVDFVLNLDCPRHIRTYVHRAGRTARAGCVGHVYTMLAPHELPRLRAMLRDAGVAEALHVETFAKSDVAQARALCPAEATVRGEGAPGQQQAEEKKEEGEEEAQQPSSKRRRTQSGSAAGAVSKDTFHTTAAMRQKHREEHLRQKRHEERAQQRKELKKKQQKEKQRKEKRKERRRKIKLLRKQQKEQEQEHQEEQQE